MHRSCSPLPTQKLRTSCSNTLIKSSCVGLRKPKQSNAVFQKTRQGAIMSKKHGSRLQVFTFREASLIIERDGLQRELNRSRKQHARELKKVKREHDCAKAAHKQRVALTHRLQRYIDYLEHKLDLV